MKERFTEQISVEVGKKVVSEKNLDGNLTLNGNRRKSGKDKGKRVLVSTGPKVKVHVLKPNNSIGSSSGISNPFDDGTRMGLKNVERSQGPITFKAIGHGLDSTKHVAVQVQSGSGVDWGKNFSDDLAAGFIVGRQSINSKSANLMGTSENFGQVPSTMVGVDNYLFLVDRAMDEVLTGL